MKQEITKRFTYWLEVAAIGIVLGLILQGARAWTEPSQAPPGGNLGAPINTGESTQVKAGSLGLNAVGTADSIGLLMNGKAQADDFCLKSDPTKCLSKGGSAPSGAVMFFNLSSCPSGWSELTAARGRYPVGLPSGGTLGATVGTALSNTENRPVGQHTHGSHEHGGGCAAGSWCSFRAASGGETGGVTDPSGTIPGTNAPYIQLLTCQKD